MNENSDMTNEEREKEIRIIKVENLAGNALKKMTRDELIGFTKDPEAVDWAIKRNPNLVAKDTEDDTGFLFTEFSKHTNFLDVVKEFCSLQPVFYDNAGIFWFWNHNMRCWVRKDEVDLMNIIDRYTKYPTVKTDVKSQLLESFKRVGRMKSPKEMPKTWVQFKNGIIDISDPTIVFPSTPDYFTVNPIPHDIGSKNETPTIDKLFREWVGDKYIQTLYEIVAYCLCADYPIQRLFCLLGDGRNGKSRFLEMVRRFVGVYNTCSTELDILLSSRFEITRLHKKLVCQMGETNFNEMRQTSIIKKLTGGDLIGFEYKNKTPFEEMNYAKIILATNNLPTTNDKTDGFYRRWLLVDFPNKFNEGRDILEDIKEEEYENLALKSVITLAHLYNVRSFSNEGSYEERAKRYEEKSNPFGKFFKENVIESFDKDIPVWEMNKRYNQWAKENRYREMSEETVGKNLKRLGIEQQLLQKEWYENDQATKKRMRCWVGITWK